MTRDKTEEIKKRHIRALRDGTKKSISHDVINSYNWTIEELSFIQPFVIVYNPNEITNHTTYVTIFTKKEVYYLLENFVENKITLKNYKSRVNALLKLFNIKDEKFSHIFKDITILYDKIITQYNDPTPYFAFLLYILGKSKKLLDCIPSNSFDILKKHFTNFKNKQTVKQLKDRRDDLDYERVYKSIFKTESNYKDEDYASMRHVITVMYTHALYDKNNIIHMNPRNYFHSIHLIVSDKQLNDTENFYNTKTGRLILNNYKTAGIYEPYDIIMSPRVQKIINDSINLKSRNYLIVKEDGGIMASNSLSEMVKRIFGYTIDTIRKSIASYEINVKKSDREHLAFVSRHTILTQEVSYLSQVV